MLDYSRNVMINAIAKFLEVVKSDRIIKPEHHLFIGPTIDVLGFLSWIVPVYRISDEVLVIAVHYLIQVNRVCPVTRLTIKRILIVCLCLASKYLDDYPFACRVMRRFNGITRDEYDKMEMMILGILDYRLYVSKDVYNWVMDQIN